MPLARSYARFALASAFTISCLALVAGCADAPVPSACETPVTFTNDLFPVVVEPKCLPCHSETLRGTARNGAPDGVDFDTYAQVRPRAAAIADAITSGIEPPQNAPVIVTSEDRALVRAWRSCGYPE